MLLPRGTCPLAQEAPRQGQQVTQVRHARQEHLASPGDARGRSQWPTRAVLLPRSRKQPSLRLRGNLARLQGFRRSHHRTKSQLPMSIHRQSSGRHNRDVQRQELESLGRQPRERVHPLDRPHQPRPEQCWRCLRAVGVQRLAPRAEKRQAHEQVVQGMPLQRRTSRQCRESLRPRMSERLLLLSPCPPDEHVPCRQRYGPRRST
ncbi:unannotated protein [freshwater metagenome]|uniref:Unannotated protein n=1 Tax=freshwater metagenome TaxID=449393 RepID=A0A6J7I941_9ZZZZ